MSDSPTRLAQLFEAIHFAARKHSGQQRKDSSSAPYINHPIAVAEVLARVGGVADVTTLIAALLHDTLEDTQTTPQEIEKRFGPEVRRIVEEVTDDKSLAKHERKRLQIEGAAHASIEARQIRVADKICNVADVIDVPPPDWSVKRRREYLEWAAHVVHECRGCNEPLQRHFERVLRRGLQALDRTG